MIYLCLFTLYCVGIDFYLLTCMRFYPHINKSELSFYVDGIFWPYAILINTIRYFAGFSKKE